MLMAILSMVITVYLMTIPAAIIPMTIPMMDMMAITNVISWKYNSNVECDISSKYDANDKNNVNGERSNDLREFIKCNRGQLGNSIQFSSLPLGQLSHPYLN